jgi:hypothetical protein
MSRTDAICMLPIVRAVERLWKSIPDARLIYHISVFHLNLKLLGTRYVYEAPQTTIRDDIEVHIEEHFFKRII